MTDRVSSKSRQMLRKSGGAIYARAKRLRGAIVVLPFAITVTISYIYLRLKYPPLGLQDLVVFSAPFLVCVIIYCKAWIYRFPAGAPLLGMSVAGALFFPMVVCLHIPYYDLVDNGFGLALAVCVWGVATYVVWRLTQPSQDMFWNMVLEPIRRDGRRWLVIAVIPLIWAGYGFGAFELIDTQFDRDGGQVLRVPVIPTTDSAGRTAVFHERAGSSAGPAACVIVRPGFLGARWRQPSACPPTG